MVSEDPSLALKADREVKAVSSDDIRMLVTLCELHKKNGRFLLHESPSSELQTMVICEWRDFSTPIHRHSAPKSESFLVIEGKLKVELGDEFLQLADTYLVNESELLVIPDHCWHKVSAVTNFAVYLEVKRGPFTGQLDAILAERWLENYE